MDFFWGKKNSSSSFPAKGAADSWYFWWHVAKPISRGYLWGVHAQSVHWKKQCWLRNQNYTYPVILKILGFQIAPHLVGKYIIPGDHYGSPISQCFALRMVKPLFQRCLLGLSQLFKDGHQEGPTVLPLKKKNRESRVIILNKALFFQGKSLKIDPCILAEKFDPLQCKNESRDSWSLIFQSMFQPTFRTELCAKILTWQTLV